MDAFKTVAAFNKYLHNYDIVQMQRKYEYCMSIVDTVAMLR